MSEIQRVSFKENVIVLASKGCKKKKELKGLVLRDNAT